MLNYLRSPVALVALLLLAQSSPAADTRQAEQRRLFQEQRLASLDSLKFRLKNLSDRLHADGKQEAATDVTRLSLRLTDSNEPAAAPRFVALPVNSQIPSDDRQWRNELRAAREETAQQLYILARKALRNGFPALAYDIVNDVLRLQPDHRIARGVMGQQMYRDRSRLDDPTYAGEWVSPYEARKRSGNRAEINHPEFGWIPVSHRARYEQGLRPWKGSWISQEKESELRRNFANAWQIETEHFLLKTNTSYEEGVALSRNLETFYGWLQSNFATFFETPQALEKRFDNVQERSRTTPQMVVHLYATRAEYDRATRGKIPAGIVTNGLYWEDDKTCFLYRSDDPNLDVAFHEATHQILDLASRDDRVKAARKLRLLKRQRTTQPWVLARNSNFWILEGIACYMESFRIGESSLTSGDPMHIRFLGAQQRLLRDNFYVDLRTLSAMGKESFRHHPNIAQLYTQGSGVVHFLMHYRGGIYRDALIQLLHDIYRPNLQQLNVDPSLEKLTGVSFDELDLQYREHLQNLAIEISQRPSP